ncbi:SDR family oxidoreductase [Sneathiella limimaris]|uniref:SDR family oxidoreductase n=1 Tax=Sneathiella limimaris TaxID=1964213 RepID=UPI00146AFEBB|nr:SDR family oxidoreductase [Sneathiella limimaris]
MTDKCRILVTGAGGLVGKAFLKLASEQSNFEVLATDIGPIKGLPDNIRYESMDVTSEDPDRLVSQFKPHVVVHLASIVTPPKGTGRDFAYKVDVIGTKNVLQAAIQYGVKRIVVTSSGAAYGYYADNPVPLTEDCQVRGNEEFPYSHHKRLVEEMLATARDKSPALEQVVFRVGTVLGERTDNQITALFQKPKLLGLKGFESPFVFIWTEDLARILFRAVKEGPAGIYNVAGDGAMGISDLAIAMQKKITWIPSWVVKAGLAIAKPLGLSQYGPEQVRFLQYRPVLDNKKLKEVFGYIPEKTSAQVFALWQKSMNL